MKLILATGFLLSAISIKAQQQIIKYGNEKTYIFTGSKINSYNEYDDMTKGLVNNDNYFDFTTDSLIVHTVYKTDNPINTYIYRKAIAAKDILISNEQNKLLPEGTAVKLVSIKIEGKEYGQMRLTTYEFDKTENGVGDFIILNFNEEDKPLAQQILTVLMDYFKKR